jgi:hypothetical protein
MQRPMVRPRPGLARRGVLATEGVPPRPVALSARRPEGVLVEQGAAELTRNDVIDLGCDHRASLTLNLAQPLITLQHPADEPPATPLSRYGTCLRLYSPWGAFSNLLIPGGDGIGTSQTAIPSAKAGPGGTESHAC